LKPQALSRTGAEAADLGVGADAACRPHQRLMACRPCIAGIDTTPASA